LIEKKENCLVVRISKEKAKLSILLLSLVFSLFFILNYFLPFVTSAPSNVIVEDDLTIRIDIDDGYIKVVPVMCFDTTTEEGMDPETTVQELNDRKIKFSKNNAGGNYNIVLKNFEGKGLHNITFFIKTIHNIPYSSISYGENNITVGSQIFLFSDNIVSMGKREVVIDVTAATGNTLELTFIQNDTVS